MNLLVLYLVLLKATATSFSGMASLPIVRDELVVHRHVLTDRQLDASIVITRSTPGAVGLYVVSVGYMAAGLPGSVMGWLAMATPALLIIPLLTLLGKRMNHPRVRSALEAIVLASSCLLAFAAVPVGRETITGPVTMAIALASFLVLLSKKVDAAWVIAGAATISLVASHVCVSG